MLAISSSVSAQRAFLLFIHIAAAFPAASPVSAHTGITLETSQPSPSGADMIRPAASRLGKSLFHRDPNGT